MIPPLCIIQARYHSTRLPGKMLLTLPDPVHGEETVIARAWRLACEAFGAEHCVVAIPESDYRGPLGWQIVAIQARVFRWDGPENDVLSRFYHCAHRYRWHPDSVIHRWTPDDPFKDPVLCRRVAAGERHPVELGGEAFTLAMLDAAHEAGYYGEPRREHITHALFPGNPPPPPSAPHPWSIDTQADYDAARAYLEAQHVAQR